MKKVFVLIVFLFACSKKTIKKEYYSSGDIKAVNSIKIIQFNLGKHFIQMEY